MKKGIVLPLLVVFLLLIYSISSIAKRHQQNDDLLTKNEEGKSEAEAIPKHDFAEPSQLPDALKEKIFQHGLDKKTVAPAEEKPKPIGFDFSQTIDAQQHIAQLVKTEFEVGENVGIILNPFFSNFECKVDFDDGNEKIGLCETEYIHPYSIPGDYLIKIEAKRGEIKREIKFGVHIKGKVVEKKELPKEERMPKKEKIESKERESAKPEEKLPVEEKKEGVEREIEKKEDATVKEPEKPVVAPEEKPKVPEKQRKEEALPLIKEEIIEDKKDEIKSRIKEKFIEELREKGITPEIKEEIIKAKEEKAKEEPVKEIEILAERREKLEEIKKTVPREVIVLEHRDEKVEELLEKIHVKRFQDEKTQFALETIKPIERGLSPEQISSELEHLSTVLVEDVPTVEERVKESIVRYEEVKKNVEIEKKVYYSEEIIEVAEEKKPTEITVVSLRVVPKKVLRDFSIFEEIPKDIAQDVSEIIFYDKNYEVIEPDPLVVWNFAVVSAPVEVSYGIRKHLSAEKLSTAKTLPIAEKIVEQGFIEERKAPKRSLFKVFLPFLLIPLFGVLIAYYHKFSSTSGEIEEVAEDRAIKEKEEQLVKYVESQLRHGADMVQIRRELLAKHWPDKMIYSIFKRLSETDKTMLEHYTRKVSLEVQRMLMKGLSREQISDFLMRKKHYPRSLIERGFRYAS